MMISPDNPVIQALRADIDQLRHEMDQLATAIQKAFQQIVAGNGKAMLELEARLLQLESEVRGNGGSSGIEGTAGTEGSVKNGTPGLPGQGTGEE